MTAGVAAVLAEGRPELDADALRGVLVGSSQRADLDPTASGAGLVDLRAAVQQEIHAAPSLLSFGAVGASGAERIVRVTNVSTRPLSVSIGRTAIAPKGVELTVDPQRLRIRPGRSADVVVRADATDVSGAATGELVLRTGSSPEVHVPWAVSVPAEVDLVSRVAIAMTGTRVSDTTPAALSFVAGSVTATPGPQVRAVDLVEVELWRGGTRLGLLRTASGAAARPVHVRADGTRDDGRSARARHVHDPHSRLPRRRHPEAGGHDRVSRPLRAPILAPTLEPGGGRDVHRFGGIPSP